MLKNFLIVKNSLKCKRIVTVFGPKKSIPIYFLNSHKTYFLIVFTGLCLSFPYTRDSKENIKEYRPCISVLNFLRVFYAFLMCLLELVFKRSFFSFIKTLFNRKSKNYFLYLFIFTLLFLIAPLCIINTMINTVNYSMTSQFSVLIALRPFLFHFCVNSEKRIIILKNQTIIYILIFFLIIILLGQEFYRSIDENNTLESTTEIFKLSISFSLYSYLPYFFHRYLNSYSFVTGISDNQNDEDDLLNDNALQKIAISDHDFEDYNQIRANNSHNLMKDDISIESNFDELQISTVIHLFELIIYLPFAYLNEDPKGQVNDLIVRIFLLKRKNMLITSFFTFYLGYKYFIFLLKKLSPSSIELIWFYFAFFGSILGLTFGRDYMAGIFPEKILRILGLFIIMTIIFIKSISPPFPSYLSYYDNALQMKKPLYIAIENDQNNSNQYQFLPDHEQIEEY